MHIEKLVRASLKIKNHKVISCTLDSTLRITFAASQRRYLPCSVCGRRAHRHDRLKGREWKHVPLWGFPVTFIYRAWRVRCPQCGIRREALPSNADIVYDKFHIIRQLRHAVNQVRVEEAQDLRKSHPEILRNTRYVILKNEENLTDKQQVRPKDLQRQKLKSTRAWLLKQAFREFWRCETEDEARGILLQWCWMGAHSRLEPITRVVRLIRRHWDGILAYFRYRISNGVVEALNNTAKAISHRARGYHSAKGFANVMLLCMGGLELPQVHHRFL